ncbi:MAG TPA: type IV toxin-antitoxin system AbiEi family antitoxin domain-containing protein [archaeon]|nr:type IV toxin-antitoxin system AbiEi family antitoxin domain-containing protein [archaeon]
MTCAIPAYGEEAYAILYNKFGVETFSQGYLKWFLSKQMTKKTFHVLEKRGWIERVGRGLYKCKTPEQAIKGMVAFRVPGLLNSSGTKYCYTKASSVEVWTDYVYMQRSWEHSPYYIKVLEKDVRFWLSYFRGCGVRAFINKPEPSLGEFVVLICQDKLSFDTVNGKPVDTLEETTSFCEKNISMFEYPLAYLVRKFKLKTKSAIDSRVMEEVGRYGS